MAIVGFIGLGNMGSALAANLVGAGHDVLTYDVSGPARNPDGATFVDDAAEVARSTDVAVLSLPNGAISEQVSATLADTTERRVSRVLDTSTVGVSAARAIETRLGDVGVGYVDAPVSGGVAGARARTLMVMYAGTDDDCAAVEPVLAGLSDRRRRVGHRAGMAQAMKLANNFLSATALAAASEAVAFGLSVGLDLATMLDVLSTSSGQSAAITDKFTNHVLTGTYSSGFANTLMAKDLGLYLDAVRAQGTPSDFGTRTEATWTEFAGAEPGVDFTRIYPHLTGDEPS